MMSQRRLDLGPVPSAPHDWKPLFRLSMELSNASSGINASELVEFLKAVPEETWLGISVGITRRTSRSIGTSIGLLGDCAVRAMKESTETQTLQGVEILKEAQQLGFKLSKTILREGRRLSINFDQ